MPSQITQTLTRDQLAQITKDPRVIKALENLLQNVATDIPASMVDMTLTVQAAQFAADSAQSSALAAIDAASRAQNSAQFLELAPPPALIDAADPSDAQVYSLAALISELQGQVDALIDRRFYSLSAQLDTLQSQVNALLLLPTP